MSQRLNSTEGRSENKNRSCQPERSRLNIREGTRAWMKARGSREDGRFGIKTGRNIPSLRSLNNIKRPTEKSPLTMQSGRQKSKRMVCSDVDFTEKASSDRQIYVEPSYALLTEPPELKVIESPLSQVIELTVTPPSGQISTEMMSSITTLSEQSKNKMKMASNLEISNISETQLSTKTEQIKPYPTQSDHQLLSQLKDISITRIPEPVKKQPKERSLTKISRLKFEIYQTSSTKLVRSSVKQLSERSISKVKEELKSHSECCRSANSSTLELSSSMTLRAPKMNETSGRSDSDDTSSLPSVDPNEQAEIVVREISAELNAHELEIESSSSPVLNDLNLVQSDASEEPKSLPTYECSIIDSEDQMHTSKEITESKPQTPVSSTQRTEEQIVPDIPTLIEGSVEQRGQSHPDLTTDDLPSMSIIVEPSEEFSEGDMETIPVEDAPISGSAIEGASQSVPDIATTTKPSFQPFSIESQKKVKVLIKMLEKYQIGVDLKLSLCIAAQWNKTLYPCLKFPGKEEGKIFSEDLPTVPLIIHFLKTQPQKLASYIPQLCWLVRGPRLELLQPHEEVAALLRTGLPEPSIRPSLMLRVVNDKYSAGEIRWQGVKGGTGTGFAFHPCSVEWAHAALHAGLQPAMFSPGPQGSGLYLTEDPDACLAACPAGFTWGKSRVGVQLRLSLLVEFSRSGVSTCAGAEGPYVGARGDGGLLFASRGELVRVRYLLVYVARPSRVPRAPPAVAPRRRLAVFLSFARFAVTIAVILLGISQTKPPAILANLLQQTLAPVTSRVSTVWAAV